MAGSSAMVGWINKHGHAKVKQFYLRGRRQSEVIIDKGELPLNTVPAAVATNGAEIYIAFQLQTTIPFGKQPILLAFSTKHPLNHHLSKHVDKAAIIFDFSSGVQNQMCHFTLELTMLCCWCCTELHMLPIWSAMFSKETFALTNVLTKPHFTPK